MSLCRFGQIDAAVKHLAYVHRMGADQHQHWAALAASALEWWRDAGVDTLVDEAPRDWLARAERAPSPGPASSNVAVERLPGTLAAFLEWRTGAGAAEPSMGPPLIVSEGDADSDLMILVDCPGESGLIDGAAGRLFDNMLAAIGRTRSDVYLAALCGARPLGGRIAPELHDRLALMLRHLVTLVGPKRVSAFGQSPSRAIIGTDGTPGDGRLHAVNLNGTIIKVVASQPPRLLLDRPALKAGVWRDLQLLMGGSR